MSEATPLQPEQTFAQGRFVLVKRLGRGGMGEVWLARDERLKEPVALKFLPPEIRGDAAALDDLRRETARSHKLSHPNIVRIHDLHEDADGTAFIVMEYIDGQTLAALRLEQPARVLAWDYLRPLVAQLCAALEYAHGEKVIHRDLKPANIMVDSRGRLKLADFGIAAVASDSLSRISVRHSTSGTLPYMSPQQVTGKRPQATDDLYALGATLYELLTGKPPFHSGDITHQVLHEPPEPMDERLAAAGMQNDVPPDAAALIMACLAKEPGQRPQSARMVAEWIGVEMVAKPSQESLAAAFFPQTPDNPAEVAASVAAGNIRPVPAANWRKPAIVGMVVLVAAGAFWLGKVIHGRDKSTAPVAAEVPAQSSVMETAPISSFNAPAAVAPDLKYGLYIHFGMDTFRHAGEKGQLPAERFAPASVNVKAWAHAAKEAGMTFAMLTAKHESGFCLWDSKDYDYDIAHSPYQGDIIGDFIAACKAEGILPGVHYSIPDAHNEGAVRYQGVVPPPYFNVIKQHLAELNSKYPELRAIRLDGSTRFSAAQLDELSRIVKRLNPRCSLWTDNVGNGTVINGWMWSPNAKLHPAQQLFNQYQQSQIAGKPFILNVGPDPSGNIPDIQIAILRQMKNLIANPLPDSPAAQPPATADWRRGLVLFFSFDDPPKNGVVRDESGTGNNGQAVNARWTAQGRRGGALQFDRTNSYVTVPNRPSLNPAQITVAAWIKTSYSGGVWCRIFDKSFDEGFALSDGGDVQQYHAKGQLDWEVGWPNHNPKTSHDVNSKPLRIDDGRWHHVAGTYDGAVQRLYLDGELLSFERRWQGRVPANNYDLTIAGNRSDPAADEVGASFDGLIDEAMMFNRALSPEEIRQLYELPASPGAAQPPAQGTVADPAASNEPDWISKEVPKPGDDGWIVLFDGKRLYGCSPPAADIASGKVSIQDGCLRLDAHTIVKFNLTARDMVIRTRLKRVSGYNATISVRYGKGHARGCGAGFLYGNAFNLGHNVDGKWIELTRSGVGGDHTGFFQMELLARGTKLTLRVDDQNVCQAFDDFVVEGGCTVSTDVGITMFQRIEARILDKTPPTAIRATPAAPAPENAEASPEGQR